MLFSVITSRIAYTRVHGVCIYLRVRWTRFIAIVFAFTKIIRFLFRNIIIFVTREIFSIFRNINRALPFYSAFSSLPFFCGILFFSQLSRIGLMGSSLFLDCSLFQAERTSENILVYFNIGAPYLAVDGHLLPDMATAAEAKIFKSSTNHVTDLICLYLWTKSRADGNIHN